MKATFRFFKELTSKNSDGLLTEVFKFSNLMTSDNFHKTYESICANYVYQIIATIKISPSTFRLAQMYKVDFTDSDSDRQKTLNEMFRQPGLYLELVTNNTEVIGTVPIINMADYWSFPLGNYLVNIDGLIPFQENDILSVRLKDRGYGLLAGNDFIRIVGSGYQEISTVYKHIVVQKPEVSALMP